MAIYRTVPCIHYLCYGSCGKNQNKFAAQHGECQHCGNYKPRSREKKYNKKRAKIDELRSMIEY